MNPYYLGSALNLSSLYMIAGLGAALSIKSGALNLGGEGQIYLGGFTTAILLVKLQALPAPLALPLALLAAFLLSGLLTLLSALLQHYRKADFLFTTYIASAATIPFIDGLISGPFRSQSDNLLATPFIDQRFRLPSIMKPSPLNPTFFLALLLCLGFFFLIYRSSWGRKLCIYGISQRFAEFSTYNTKALSFSSAIVSGGMHGLCGGLAICGTYFTCHQGFYSGMGWNAFSASLIASSNPLFIIPSSLFMGFITTYSNKYALYHNFGFDMGSLLQALILLLISFPIFKKEAK
ncbi:MAG: ABC transporter permease [Treponema sp.]|nr:ABC transporter permease [Treponema sp.]